MQGHYHLGWPPASQFRASIQAFADLDVDVMISELDVSVLDDCPSNPYTNGMPPAIRTELANKYRELFEVLVQESDKVSRVTFWGVTDGNSWLNGFPCNGRTNHPLLFDRAGLPKEAFYSVVGTAE
jgi:endo-1,4-beta-xylanase